MPDDILQQIDQEGTKADFRAPEIGGKKYPAGVAADPFTGELFRTAGQADAQDIRDRLPASGAASEVGQAAILAELASKLEPSDLAALATGAKQDAGNTSLATLVTTLAAIAGAVATETTLAALLARTPAAPATEGKQDAIAAAIAAVLKTATRRDSDTGTAAADGDPSPLFVNEYGRLKVSTMPGIYNLITGAITASAQTVSVDVSRSSNVQIHVVAASLSGHNVTFEGSIDSTDGTNGAWFGIQVVRSNANTIETTSGVLTTTPAYAWEASVNGLAYIRVRATAHTGGTATWKFQRGSYATEPIPATQVSGTQPVSGTVTVSSTTANIGTSGITVYTDSATVLAAGSTFTGTSRDAGSTVAYNMFCAHAFADQAGTLRVEKSTDGTTWRLAKTVALAAGEAQELVVRVTARYHRVVFTNGATLQTAFSLTSSYQRI